MITRVVWVSVLNKYRKNPRRLPKRLVEASSLSLLPTTIPGPHEGPSGAAPALEALSSRYLALASGLGISFPLRRGPTDSKPAPQERREAQARLEAPTPLSHVARSR